MDRDKALKQLRIMRDWHEDNGDGPNADYNAICAGIAALETQEYYEKLITAMEQEHAKLREMQKAQPEIILCRDCKHSEYDAMYGDRYCHHNGKAEIVPDNQYCGYSERRTDERSD